MQKELRDLTRALCLFGLANLMFAGPAAADEQGRALYETNCMLCHGFDAKGDGFFADQMNIDIPALTGLSAENGGTFPMADIVRVIDGRKGVRAHGSQMPVWGTMLADRYGDPSIAARLQSRGDILSIVYYLESIQQ